MFVLSWRDTSRGTGLAKRTAPAGDKRGVRVRDFETLAAQIDGAMAEGRSIARVPDLTLDEARRTFGALHGRRRARGEKPVGRKIGFTNRTIWGEYGVYAPNWGYMTDCSVFDVQRSGAFSLQRFAEPRIEPEIVFGLSAVPSAEMDEAALMRCIGWVAHGFEIVHSIFPNWKFTPAETLAANALHGALLIGPKRRIVGARIAGCKISPRSKSRFIAMVSSSTGAGLRTCSAVHSRRCAISCNCSRMIKLIRRSWLARSSPRERSREHCPLRRAKLGGRS